MSTYFSVSAARTGVDMKMNCRRLLRITHKFKNYIELFILCIHLCAPQHVPAAEGSKQKLVPSPEADSELFNLQSTSGDDMIRLLNDKQECLIFSSSATLWPALIC